MFFEKGEAIRLSDAFTYPIPFRKIYDLVNHEPI